MYLKLLPSSSSKEAQQEPHLKYLGWSCFLFILQILGEDRSACIVTLKRESWSLEKSYSGAVDVETQFIVEKDARERIGRFTRMFVLELT